MPFEDREKLKNGIRFFDQYLKQKKMEGTQ